MWSASRMVDGTGISTGLFDMTDDEPNLVTSSKSQRVLVDGHPFAIEIYRLEEQMSWTLEVVDHDGTSHVWEEQFGSDGEAINAAIAEIEREGPVAFMRGDNVIPFPGAT